MAADGESPHDDGGGSESSASTSSASPCPPSTAAAHPPPPPSLPPPPASSSSSAPTAAAAALPLPSHLHYQQRLLSLHLSPAAATTTTTTPASASQPRGTSSEPSPVPPSDRPSRDDCWSENATLTLIQAWGDRYLELNRGNLKQKHWKDVADCVNSRPLHSSKPPKTDIQCKNRIDTLKKKYKIERSKLVSTGGAPRKWAFFDRLDELIGSSKKPKTSNSGKVSRPAAAVADGTCTSNPDGHCTGMPAAKGTMEEDVKPPLFFIPPHATIAVPPPPLMNHHVGGVVVHMNHHVGNLLHLNPHVGPPIIHHLTGEGAHINHHAGLHTNFLPVSMAGPAAVNHQAGDIGGGAAAADTGSKSKAGADASPSSPPHKRSGDTRRRKRKRPGLSPKEEDDSFRELARAISKFGDVYERVEIAKLQQATALEKQRRELAKDLEIQRMQLFMQMQFECAKMKYGSSKHSNTEEHS